MQELRKNVSDEILKSILEEDPESGKTVRNLMVIWEDILRVSDRSMQEALLAMDARQIAQALSEASDEVTEKIKNNLSERASAMVDEEISIMPSISPEEIEDAREVCLGALRELNENNMLTWA